ncbi:MAG: hypothetical protein S4CHLAM6_06630 [Chlamydiae bacterium]|nr:hypothetical protein [Chlamydiota bacterium]
MKRLLLSLFIPTSLLIAQGVGVNPFSPMQMEQSQKLNRILVENRVLTNVNNTPISVVDVMKKMDTEFFVEYPHLMDSDVARYQFYKARWRHEFDRMVESELIISDAKAHKLELTEGDIRQELEKRFGPEVIINIDQIGLTYDEAYDLVKKDILTQRMSQGFLYLKGVFNISPDDLLTAYREYIKVNKKPDHWKYHMISFRGPNALEDSQMAKLSLERLSSETKSFNALCMRFKDKTDDFENKQISISKEFDLESDQIQESHRDILSNLTPHSFSEPIKEHSRIKNQPVYRIFHLNSYEAGGKIKLAEVEEKLIYQHKQEKYEQEYINYVTNLRERSGLTKDSINAGIPEGFEPFRIK